MKTILSRTLAAVLAAVMIFGLVPAVSAAPAKAKLSDYDGTGMVIAVVDGGFDVEHEVFTTAPASPRLQKTDAESMHIGSYVSVKVPFAHDYADGDADVFNPYGNLYGTACASIAAGYYDAGPDVKNEDGTYTHPKSYRGVAPNAQLLLLKAAKDNQDGVDPSLCALAIREAVELGADVICLSWRMTSVSDDLRSAVKAARRAGIPVFVGAGVLDHEVQLDYLTPAAIFGEGLCCAASLEGATVVSAGNSPFSGVNYCTINYDPEAGEPDYEAGNFTNADLTYTDSCDSYFGATFAAYMNAGTYDVVAVPGYGRAADYAGLNVRGKLALVKRGEITFAEKTKYAEAAGAVGVIVYNNEYESFRMSLDNAVLPAVSIDGESGEVLAELAKTGLKLTFHKAESNRTGAAGIGFTPNGKSVDLLADGEAVSIAYSSESAKYTTASGTAFAAANAAGAAACAKQYCAAVGSLRTDAGGLSANADAILAVLRSACDAIPLPFDTVGAGRLNLDKVLPSLRVSAVPVTLTQVRGSSARFEVTLTNPEPAAVRVTVSAQTLLPALDEWGYIMKGLTDFDAVVRLGDSLRDITEEPVVVTLKAGQTMTLTFSTIVSDEAKEALKEDWGDGCWLETFVTFATETESQTILASAYIGDWENRPFGPPSVFETNEFSSSGADLYFYEYSESEGKFYPYLLGTEERWESYPADGSFTTKLCVVSSANLLKDGWISVNLSLIRSCEAITIRVTDANGKVLHERTREGAESGFLSGSANIPLWDFRAEDFDDYVWPDGDYLIEVILSSGKVSQTHSFPITIDSVCPTVSYTVKKSGGRELLSVTASDNIALWDLYATDMSEIFAADEYIPCVQSVSVVIDVTGRDPQTPLYIYAVDYAGNVKVLRIAP